MPAIALTDYGNMFGALEFYFSALEKNINPILGCELYYTEDSQKKNPQAQLSFRHKRRAFKTLVLLAVNNKGYKNLCHINTEAWQKGFYYVPRSDYKSLEQYKEGLIALTGGIQGRVPHLFLNQGKESARKEIQILQKIFGPQLYLQLQPEWIASLENGKNPKSGALAKSSFCEEYNLFLVEEAQAQKLQLTAGADVHYVEKKDHVAQDILSCIKDNRTLYDKERQKLEPCEFYFKSGAEMRQGFKNNSALASLYQTACDTTLNIAEQCHVRFKTEDKNKRPIYHLPQVAKGESSLKELTEKGLKSRFQDAEKRGQSFPLEKQKIYKQRILSELDIIKKTGFEGYFLIVHDFIQWAKNNNIPVGPGRGSAAGSLVSYCLGITDLDPMPLKLIFERFLNPERISMPDFDIDFCQENRHRVIEYITEKYGRESSSHVTTYGRLNVRAAVRDVGRVLALSYNETDRIAKLIPDILGVTLQEALKKEPRLKSAMEEDPKINEMIQLTGMLEGLIRQVSIHAAGIIIADNPLINYAPLYTGKEGENVIQYDLKHAEKIGLVKFDFLGLKTLTCVAEAFRLIKETQGKTITTKDISIDDSGIYEIMSRGDTVGIFQFEGAGIRDLLIKSRPTCFEDIIAVNALYRPGPMQMIPSYLDRKKARVPVEYIFPDLEDILKETYGIIVYQEQVQQIAVKIAGYSYAEADVLRRSMGKKIRSVMEKQKTRFLEGAKQKNYNLKKAEQLFDFMAEFAKYGFNKSHSAAYCVLAAQTAWLKYYYPVEFLAAQMSIDQNDSDKLINYVRDAKDHSIPVLSPHINSSCDGFSIDKGRIRFSLSAIKGVGQRAAQEIVAIKESLKGKSFSNLNEFFAKTAQVGMINKKTIESLIKSGAMDGFGLKRWEIFENMDHFILIAEKRAKDRASGQKSFFDNLAEEKPQMPMSKQKPWSRKEELAFEKSAFGFYLNGHPMKALEGMESDLNCSPPEDLKQKGSNLKSAETLVMISNIKELITKKTKQLMAFALLENSSSSIEGVFFPEVYEKAKALLLREGEVFHIKGSLKSNRGGGLQMVVEQIEPVDDFLKQTKKIAITLNQSMGESQLAHLKKALNESLKGPTKVDIQASFKDSSGKPLLLKVIPRQELKDIQLSYDFLQKTRKLVENGGRIRLFAGKNKPL